MSHTDLLSGRRGSNPPPIAWKAIALPNELLPLIRFRFWFLRVKISTPVAMWGEKDSNLRSFRNGFTVRPIWPLWYLPFSESLNSSLCKRTKPMEGFEPPTHWLQISSSGQLSYIGKIIENCAKSNPPQKGIANVRNKYYWTSGF